MIKFKERVRTDKINVILSDIRDMSFKDFEDKLKSYGYLMAGIHYFLHPSGEIEAGNDEGVVADWSLPDNDKCLYVLAIGKRISDAQRFALDRLAASKALKWELLTDVSFGEGSLAL